MFLANCLLIPAKVNRPLQRDIFQHIQSAVIMCCPRQFAVNHISGIQNEPVGPQRGPLAVIKGSQPAIGRETVLISVLSTRARHATVLVRKSAVFYFCLSLLKHCLPQKP